MNNSGSCLSYTGNVYPNGTQLKKILPYGSPINKNPNPIPPNLNITTPVNGSDTCDDDLII
jgi:hypothetical protein